MLSEYTKKDWQYSFQCKLLFSAWNGNSSKQQQQQIPPPQNYSLLSFSNYVMISSVLSSASQNKRNTEWSWEVCIVFLFCWYIHGTARPHRSHSIQVLLRFYPFFPWGSRVLYFSVEVADEFFKASPILSICSAVASLMLLVVVWSFSTNPFFCHSSACALWKPAVRICCALSDSISDASGFGRDSFPCTPCILPFLRLIYKRTFVREEEFIAKIIKCSTICIKHRSSYWFISSSQINLGHAKPRSQELHPKICYKRNDLYVSISLGSFE